MRKHAGAIIAIAVGIAFVAVGVWRGEMAAVLHQAAVICLECIGLG